MFKSIQIHKIKAISNFNYKIKIIDSDFQVLCGLYHNMSSITWKERFRNFLTVYQDKKLNIPANIVLFLKYTGESYDFSEQVNREIKKLCIPYQSEINKYLLLL